MGTSDIDDDAEPDDSKPVPGWAPLRWLRSCVVSLFVMLIRGYQILISPMLGPSCRFTPTCSSYAIEAIRMYGPVRGSWAAAKRIARCHPWNPGGYDPP